MPDPDRDSPVLIVHRSNDGKEMEALSVRQKRAQNSSSPTLSPHASNYDIDRKDIRTDEGPLPKKSAKQPVSVQSRDVEFKEVGSNIYSIPVRNRFVGNF